MTDRVVPFEIEDPARRVARAARLNAAFTVLVDPQRDPDSISLAARLAGGEVLTLDDVVLGAERTYDPLAFGRPGGGRGLLVQNETYADALAASNSSQTTSRTANSNQD